MKRLHTHGALSFWTGGENQTDPPYIIGYGENEIVRFGSKRLKPGSQAQLRTFYAAKATWDVLTEIGDEGSIDAAEKTAHAVARAAQQEIKRNVDFFYTDYVHRVRERFQRRRKPAVTPGAPELPWRRSASGRLDAFTPYGSYHVQGTPEGFGVRWSYQDRGAFLGTFRTEAEAKREAERHAAAQGASEPTRRRKR